jgi:hypothetical protein
MMVMRCFGFRRNVEGDGARPGSSHSVLNRRQHSLGCGTVRRPVQSCISTLRLNESPKPNWGQARRLRVLPAAGHEAQQPTSPESSSPRYCDCESIGERPSAEHPPQSREKQPQPTRHRQCRRSQKHRLREGCATLPPRTPVAGGAAVPHAASCSIVPRYGRLRDFSQVSLTVWPSHGRYARPGHPSSSD